MGSLLGKGLGEGKEEKGEKKERGGRERERGEKRDREY